MGAHSTYTPEMAAKVCEYVAEGHSLRSLIAEGKIPARGTIVKWLTEREEFAVAYAQARETQGDVMDEMILETAQSVSPETAQADRVRIDAYKWRAERLRPRRYGVKITSELSGPDGGPIKTEEQSATTSQLAQALLSVLEMGKGKP